MITTVARPVRLSLLLACVALAGLQVSCPGDEPPPPAASQPIMASTPAGPTPTIIPAGGPAISQVTFERSGGGASRLGFRDGAGADHSYSYAMPADGDASFRFAVIMGAQWGAPDTLTFLVTTAAAPTTALSASNLQLVALQRSATAATVTFEPAGSTAPGDEVTAMFGATNGSDAMRLATAIAGSEAAAGRLTLSQPAGSTWLTVSYRLQ